MASEPAEAASVCETSESTKTAELEPAQIVDGVLSLAGRDLDEFPSDLGTKFGSQVKTLTLSYNQLTKLAGLDEFANLLMLEVDNNELADISGLPKLPHLHTLSANNNKLDDIDRLLELFKENCPALQYLSLLKNPACPHALAGGDDDEYRRYRHRVIYNLPSLKFLDSQPISALERKEANRVGPFLKVARPTSEAIVTKPAPAKVQEENTQPEYRPLSSDLTPMGEHSGSFGQCKYVYYGRHSEGNRFISNNML